MLPKLCFALVSIHSRSRRSFRHHAWRVFINQLSTCWPMQSATAQLHELIWNNRMAFLTAKHSKDSGRCTNAKASPASTAAQRFGAPRTAGDQLTGVRGVRGDNPQITQITQIRKFSHKKAQKTHKQAKCGDIAFVLLVPFCGQLIAYLCNLRHLWINHSTNSPQ